MTDESEDSIKTNILLHYGLRQDMKLFINMVAQAWVGKVGTKGPGWLKLLHPRTYPCGLGVGSSDLIGWIILQGRAVFVAFEVKTKTGKPTADQLNFIDVVKKSGGIAGVVRGVLDCELLIAEYKKEHGIA